MNQADKDRYYIPMRKVVEMEVFHELDSYGFDKWLKDRIGVDVYGEYLARHPQDDYPLSDDLKELFTAMTGPHWRTILRVYQIRKGLKHV